MGEVKGEWQLHWTLVYMRELKGQVSTRAINLGGREFEGGVLSIQMLFKVSRLDEIIQKVRRGGGNILGLNLGPSCGMRKRISKRRICQWNGKKRQ